MEAWWGWGEGAHPEAVGLVGRTSTVKLWGLGFGDELVELVSRISTLIALPA